MSARSRLVALAASATAAAVALGGCGIGAGSTPGAPIGLSVTRDFGTTSVAETHDAKTAGADTVMRVLQRNTTVQTRYGGNFVQSINGIRGGRRDGRPVDWFIYVNGILTDQGAGAVDVHGGDRIWWDHHDWGVTPDTRAVVGSFPEPFLHGSEGRRLPVRVECADPKAGACSRVAKKLIAYGIPAGRSSISRSAADESLRILVGPWSRLRGGDAEADALDDGPKASGVYARFDDEGRTLTVLDERGRVARTLGAGSGLIAATRAKQRQPVWFVTGTDDAGVESAARALEEGALSNRFALAIADDLPVAVPAKAR
ncbi:MAG: hypothetical protein QOE31_1488 [Solirubrobacteraceae bacterium]|nr:hypothetical protein [Solirubrobacteraceae bacterium]